MNRRETIKTLLIGSLASGAVISGCKAPETVIVKEEEATGYGRTPEEQEVDRKLMTEEFLNATELATIATLCDIILPASPTAGSAVEAGVPEFIAFIVKDIPRHQLVVRGGLMWLDSEAISRFNKDFNTCTEEERLAIVDDIAYPKNARPEMEYGARFFSTMRNLVLTGYYTSKMGIEDLGYVGNQPNVWDGVPKEVLEKHGLAYEEEWLAKCVDQSQRNTTAEWDEEGNLLT
ncbi:MAG: gluconate 2-dehydrogenase subunit 3 family protein [Bacteroidota bacterium]